MIHSKQGSSLAVVLTLLLGTLVLGFVSSCAVVGTGTIRPGSQGGTMALDLGLSLEMHPIFVEYLTDLKDSLGEGQGPLFDEGAISQRFAREEGVRLVSFSQGRSGFSMNLQVASLGALANNPRFSSLISWSNRGTDRVLRLRLGPRLVQAALSYASPGEEDALAYVLPSGQTKSRVDYEKQLQWSLGDYGSSTELQAMFASSNLRLNINLPGPIKSVTGFTRNGNRAVSYTINVLDVLVTNSERTLELVF